MQANSKQADDYGSYSVNFTAYGGEPVQEHFTNRVQAAVYYSRRVRSGFFSYVELLGWDNYFFFSRLEVFSA